MRFDYFTNVCKKAAQKVSLPFVHSKTNNAHDCSYLQSF